MYNHLAQYYDWQGSDAFADFITNYLQAQFGRLDLKKDAYILDLGCGTGSTAIQLAEVGYTVTGVDSSQAMLDLAKEKASEIDLLEEKVIFITSDMVTYKHKIPVDVIISTYDSVNHVSPEKLTAFFKTCAANLKVGGSILFDVNTLENYQQFWQGKDTDETENARIITNSNYDELNSKATAEILIQSHNEKGYTETQDVVEQYYLTDELLVEALTQTGFSEVKIEPLALDFLEIGLPLKKWVQATFL